MFFPCFLSVALSVFLAIYNILEPETAPSTELQTFWNFRIETLGSQENLICLCSSSFFYKETRYWVALNVYQKNIIGVHYAILISMGLWLQNQQNIE